MSYFIFWIDSPYLEHHEVSGIGCGRWWLVIIYISGIDKALHNVPNCIFMYSPFYCILIYFIIRQTNTNKAECYFVSSTINDILQ